jgi:hypothetical protein
VHGTLVHVGPPQVQRPRLPCTPTRRRCRARPRDSCARRPPRLQRPRLPVHADPPTLPRASTGLVCTPTSAASTTPLYADPPTLPCASTRLACTRAAAAGRRRHHRTARSTARRRPTNSSARRPTAIAWAPKPPTPASSAPVHADPLLPRVFTRLVDVGLRGSSVHDFRARRPAAARARDSRRRRPPRLQRPRLPCTPTRRRARRSRPTRPTQPTVAPGRLARSGRSGEERSRR